MGLHPEGHVGYILWRQHRIGFSKKFDSKVDYWSPSKRKIEHLEVGNRLRNESAPSVHFLGLGSIDYLGLSKEINLESASVQILEFPPLLLSGEEVYQTVYESSCTTNYVEKQPEFVGDTR